jgi:hypothetical protein
VVLDCRHMEEALLATALSDELRVSVSAEEATPEQPPAASPAPVAEEEAERPSHLTEAVAEALAVSEELRSFTVDGAAQPACAPPEGARTEAHAVLLVARRLKPPMGVS